MPPWRRLPRGAPAPAALACPLSGAPGRGTGPGGRREPGALRRGHGADRGICCPAGAERCTRSPCRDLGGRRCPGIDQPAAGRRGLSCPDALALQGFAGAPFFLAYLFPPPPFLPLLLSLSAPLPAACVPVRGAEGGEAGAEPGAALALAAFDVSFECRRLARSWLPPYAVLGAGRRPLKGHCRQRRAWRGARSRLRVPPAAAAAEPPLSPAMGLRPDPPELPLFGARGVVFSHSPPACTGAALCPSACRERKEKCFVFTPFISCADSRRRVLAR